MDCSVCPLFGLQSKRVLQNLLYINDKKLMRQDYLASLVSPYIDTMGKPRLIEPPKEDLKKIQTRIKNLLSKIPVPSNVFSGVKGKSYADNARFHTGDRRRNVFKIDIHAFFPSICRETVYRFFRNDLQCSSDVSEILCNLTTIDLTKAHISDKSLDSVSKFLVTKKISCTNHLISGAPTSQILSYLVNHEMFDEMQRLADKHRAIMTVYVDDVTFSSEEKISSRFRNGILTILTKYGYKASKSKVLLYSKAFPKVITGVVVNAEGVSVVKNSIRFKIITEYHKLLKEPDNFESRKRLRGLLLAARQVDRGIFPTIYSYAFSDNFDKE